MSTTRIKGSNGVIIDGSRYLELPKGVAADRPSTARAGMIRYNYDANTNARGVEVCLSNSPATGENEVLEWRPVAVLNPIDGKLDSSLLPASIQGAMVYRGTWDASTNTPSLPNLPDATSGNAGFYYIVSADGNGNGANDLVASDIAAGYKIGDWVVSTGSLWDKIDYNATSTTAGNVELSVTGFRSKHNMSAVNLVQVGFQQIVESAVDRLNGDQIEGTITFNNASSSAYLRIKDGSSGSPGLSFSTDTNTGLYRSAEDQISFSLGGTTTSSYSKTFIKHDVQLRGALGAASAPQYSFWTDSQTGMFLQGSSRLGFSTGGVARLVVSDTGITLNRVIADSGTAAEPAYTFNGDENTGMYRSGAESISFSANGLPRLTITPSIIDANVNIRVPTGTSTSPSYTFDGNENTGIFRPSPDQVAISTNGITRLTLTSTNAISAVPVHGINGTITVPTYSFSDEPTTGFYKSAASTISVSATGTEVLKIGKTVFSNIVQQQALDGSAAVPAYSFTSDSNTGLYRSAEGQLTVSSNGTSVMSFSSGAITANKKLIIPSGDASAQGLSFSGNTDTGLFSMSETTMGISVDNIEKMAFSTTSVDARVPLLISNGTAAAPGFAFSSDSNTGIYSELADNLGFTAGGTGILKLSPTAATFTKPVYVPAGSASTVGLGFDGVANTGIYRSATDQLTIAAGGVGGLSVNPTLVTANIQIAANNSGKAAPGYTFGGKNDSGMYHAGSGQIGIVSNAVESALFTNTMIYARTPINMGVANDISWYGTSGRYSRLKTNADASQLRIEATDTTSPFTFGNAASTYMTIHPSALVLPKGTDANIAVAVEGMIRYDTADQKFVGYSKGKWDTIGGSGVIDNAGTSTAPSMSWDPDTDTGFFHPAEDTIGVTTGGVERFRFDNTGNKSYGQLSIITPTGTAKLGSMNSSWFHIYSDKPIWMENAVEVQGDIGLYSKSTKFDYTTGKVQENGRWLEDKYFETSFGNSTGNLDTEILSSAFNGVSQRTGNGPAGGTTGVVLQASTDAGRFQMYASSDGSIHVRTGLNSTLNPWTQLMTSAGGSDNASKLDGLTSSQFLRSDVSDTMDGQLIFSRTPRMSITNLNNASALFGTAANGLGIDGDAISKSGGDLWISTATANRAVNITTGGSNSNGLSIRDTGITANTSALFTSTVSVLDKVYANGGINMGSGTAGNREIRWAENTDGAVIGFKGDVDSSTDNYMYFETLDNGNEFFKFRHTVSGVTDDWMDIKGTGITVTGNTNKLGNWDITANGINHPTTQVLNMSGSTLTIGQQVGGNVVTQMWGRVQAPSLYSGTAPEDRYMTMLENDGRYRRFVSEIGDAVNLNTLTAPGRYHQASNAEAASGVNYPIGVAGQLDVYNDVGYIYQRYHSYGPENQMYNRTFYNGAWSAWQRLSRAGESYTTSETDSRYVSSGNGTVGNLTVSNNLTVNGTNTSISTSGNIFAAKEITAWSDIRLKKNITVIDGALDKISLIRGCVYDRTDYEGRQAGVIAQEIQAVLPEVVKEGEDGLLSVAYGNLSALIIEAVKEEKAKREALEDEVAELKALVKQLLAK